MKLGILSAVWGRPRLTELFLDRLGHLRKELNVIPGVVGTDDMFMRDCFKRGILYADCPNKPLGTKWNAGMQVFRDIDVTHVMILGSDDFVSDDFVRFAMKFAEDKDFCGCKDMYMFGGNPKRKGWQQLYYFRYQGTIVGPGRCYSKDIIERMDYTPWNVNRNAGLDGSIAKSVKMLGSNVRRGSFIMEEEGLFMVDIKTVGNISGIPGGAKPTKGLNLPNMLRTHLPKGEAWNLITYLNEINAL